MSNTKIIWHGSPIILERPEYGKGKSYNDYGRGFYCTESKELACEWACNDKADGHANQYEIQLDGLKILSLSDEPYHILNWLALLMDNRRTRLSTAVSMLGAEYLHDIFLPDISAFDVIVGYRADDSYFSFARSFVNNEISLAQLSRAMRLGKLGEQFVLKSPPAFDALKYLGNEMADHTIYYPKRRERDQDARSAYRKEVSVADLEGIYMRDIIRERIGNDDARLR